MAFIHLEVALHALSGLQGCDIRQFFAVVQYIIKHLFYEQRDLYYFGSIKMTLQAWSKFTENTPPAALILHSIKFY